MYHQPTRDTIKITLLHNTPNHNTRISHQALQSTWQQTLQPTVKRNSSMAYNGSSNWATHEVASWILNADETNYNAALRLAREIAPDNYKTTSHRKKVQIHEEVAEALQTWVTESHLM